MPFTNELEFEKELIRVLTSECGWKDNVIKNPTEEDLIKNWADILFKINKEVDVLNNCPLTDGEIRQLLNEIYQRKTPVSLNDFINAKTVPITRDNENDRLHFGKIVRIKIFNRKEIGGGSSRYQIAEQPRFKTNNPIYPSRRADLMLLINGLPLFHIELKKTGVSLTHAEVQLEKYMVNNCYTGFFSLVQIFVAMNPEEAVYFANPGPVGKFNPRFYFKWADFNNNPILEWQEFARSFLSIPLAHQIIGFYTIADKTDNTLKVMRSYQIYAAQKISDKVKNPSWTKKEQPAGYIWHTTGSGKTMTSFKTAQLISENCDAEKIVFLIDRIELGKQTYGEYSGFATADITIIDTEDTDELISLLKSKNPDSKLIITSIQKMSRINKENTKQVVLEKIQNKHIVFIVDECHRDQAGDMHQTIKKTFPSSMFFGFTGTPDLELTKDIFGDELHRYTIVNGIKDRNVLGFDPIIKETFSDREIKEQVALYRCNCANRNDAISDENKRKIFNKYMRMNQRDIETEFKKITGGFQYSPLKDSTEPTKHMVTVVEDILDDWGYRSVNRKFSAILATTSIKEAIIYYKEFKKQQANRYNEKPLKITAVFDTSDNNEADTIFKMNGITEILTDYNCQYRKKYSNGSIGYFKKDVCERLAHKESYSRIEEEDKIDLVIVVDQLLTGFDSKWINTLYLDKVLEGKNFVQAISRTNRLCDDDKPHGTIEWFRYPHTMDYNLKKAIKDYSGENEFGIFVNKLGANIDAMNSCFRKIKDLFEQAGIENYSTISDEEFWQKAFANEFTSLVHYMDSAKIQGFNWDEQKYTIEENGTKSEHIIAFDRHTFNLILQRYKDLFNGGTNGRDIVTFDIDTHIIEMPSDKIDEDYVDSKFKLYMKDLLGNNPEAKEKAEIEIHNIFATLPADKQQYADLFLHDIQSGNIMFEEGKSLDEYIAGYMLNELELKILKMSDEFGLDREQLKNLKTLRLNESNIDSFNRYTNLVNTAEIDKVVEHYSKICGSNVSRKDAMQKLNKDLREFLLEK